MADLQKKSRALTDELSQLVSTLPNRVSEKRVHRVRTTIRRLETLVNQRAPKLNKKQQKSLDELRALRKRAGKVRDLDIQLGLLTSIANGSAAADRRALSDVLKQRRDRQQARLLSRIKKLNGSKVFNRLEKIAEKIGEMNPGPSADVLQNAQKELTRLASRYASREALKPGRLHELRISLKLLRYRAELAEDGVEKQDFIAAVKSAQDAIGEWHDWQMLAQNAEKLFGSRINCALLLEIRSLFAARYSAATSAAVNLLSAYAPVPRKKPASVQPLLMIAQHA
jgi:CHAD domain-containing protein